jgi:enediyne biosynthesis protein E4
LNDSIRHSGWSWGCSALDFDNDGYPDVYVANGHETRESVKDYDCEFWLHDIYVGTSADSRLHDTYFRGKFARTRGQGQSYGGYEKNRLFWNQRGSGFLEIGYLMGVGVAQDSRNVAAEDLDGDGRVDLLLTTFEVWPNRTQTLQVFRNELPSVGHWTGFRARDQSGRCLPPGTRLTVRHPGGTSVREFVTGNSHRAQESGLIHFGLGTADHIDSLEVQYPNQPAISTVGPKADAYQTLPSPSSPPVSRSPAR